MVPKVRGRLNGIASIRIIENRLVQPVGFSNGCAELALKKPPPLVPSSLTASCEAAGPPGIAWVAPLSVVTSVNPVRFWMTPPASSMIVATIDSGRRSTPRVRSTQKLPMVPERRSIRPRTRATATAMPTAQETKFCTASPRSCTV
ncbi:MAG: hypothetical protein JWP54_3344 [Cryobacterium sp.]|nr:hypothetical protein [Cryobacterium sp.]